jgi:hypothetical protein
MSKIDIFLLKVVILTRKVVLFILKTTLKIVLVVFVLFYRFYSSDAIDGFVYDAETNQPLEGVEVEVYWELDYGFIFYMTIIVENFKTKTDKNGYFYFPAWGPKLDGRRRFSNSRISFNRENYERETFGYHERYYGSLFFDSWVIIGRTKYGYDNIDNKIRLKRLKSNVKK